jgi:CarD family transcriptional regulator
VPAKPNAKPPVKQPAPAKTEKAAPAAKAPAAKAPAAKAPESKALAVKSAEPKVVVAKSEPNKSEAAAKPAPEKKIAAKPDRASASGVAGKPEAKGARKDGGKSAKSAAAAAPQPVVQRPKAQLAAGSSAAPAVVTMKDNAVKSLQTTNAGKTQAPAPAAPVKATDKSVAKPSANRSGFKVNEFIVYPAHGVGQIISIDEQEVAGFKLELFVINFMKDKMTLKVPMPKVLAGAIRKLADAETVQKALDILTGRARIKRTMWSRRAQEYEAKINSGDLLQISEVVRDLYRSEAQPEQSYSERQLYEAALDRMAREIAAVQKLTETEALKLIESQLQKGPRRGGKADAEAEAGEDVDAESEADEGDVDEAA